MRDNQAMDIPPVHFYDEPIEVIFDHELALEKKPDCPSGFIWRGETFRVAVMLAEWQDFRRRGRMARNMMPKHDAHASLKGSWGVGKFFFSVQVEDGRFFDIYYDRAPGDASDRKGHWFLLCERHR
jgi:hypothetical protein